MTKILAISPLSFISTMGIKKKMILLIGLASLFAILAAIISQIR